MAAATPSTQFPSEGKRIKAREAGRPGQAPPKRAAPFRCRLVVMVKVPETGRVKTRLAHEIGDVRAAWFYRHTTVARLARPGRWQTFLAVSPDAGIRHAFWPPELARLRQGSGDLGQRMQRAMQSHGPGPVIIVGTDVPAIRPSHIAAAFKSLGDCDAVFGPATDGGYWLVGQRRRPRELEIFRNVRWSTPNALADTLRNLRGWRTGFVATLSDVDTAEDWKHVAAWCGRRVLPIPDCTTL